MTTDIQTKLDERAKKEFEGMIVPLVEKFRVELTHTCGMSLDLPMELKYWENRVQKTLKINIETCLAEIKAAVLQAGIPRHQAKYTSNFIDTICSLDERVHEVLSQIQ